MGEYNLRLGIIKELAPDMVATHQDAGCTHEGHPTIVEAGVCLGFGLGLGLGLGLANSDSD